MLRNDGGGVASLVFLSEMEGAAAGGRESVPKQSREIAAEGGGGIVFDRTPNIFSAETDVVIHSHPLYTR